MNINIKLDKNFTTVFNKLKQEYGPELLKLNGFSDSQLNYGDFIDNFVEKNNTANASIDSNANVGVKDITSLIHEMNKPHMKLLSFNKIFYELNKKYGYSIASEWLTNEWTGKFYLHDAVSSSMESYCIMPQECCSFIYGGKRIHCSFIDAYDMINEKENYDQKNKVYYKCPKNLLVLDYDIKNEKIKYTKVTMISKKNSDKDFYFVKSHNGSNIFTTQEHKFITNHGEIESQNLQEDEDALYCIDDSNHFTNSIYEYNGLELTSELGWLVGMYLAQGYEQRGQLSICQSPEASPEEYNKIIEILNKLGIPYNNYDTSNAFGNSKIVKRATIRMKNGDNNWERKLKKIFKGKYCNEKRLCLDYCHFNDQFLKGMLAGIIDGDGTISNNRICMIRMTSRTLINQIRQIGLHFGVYFGSRLPYIQSQNAKIKQKKPMYSANVNMNRNKDFFMSLPSIKIHNLYTHFQYDEKFANNNYVCKFGQINTRDVEKTYKPSELVFDLSTQSHTFICNNILVHNCFSYDLTDLATKGLYFINNFNAEPPKHLTTFTDFVTEYISWVSNRTSGGCSIPNFLIWSYYFWKKDVESGYYIKSPEYYRDQQMQRHIYKLNQPFLRITQCAYVTMTIMDKDYLVELFGGMEYPDGTYVIDYIDEIIEYQKAFVRVMHEIRRQNMSTFPVCTYSLLYNYETNKFVNEDFARWCSDENSYWMDFNFSIDDSVTALSSCCRLRNDTKDIQLGKFSSIGGSALQVGSVKVNSINLARIAYESQGDEEKYLKILEERCELCCKVLDIIRNIIKRNVEKGLLPNYTLKMINIHKQYSTIGICALFEAIKKFGYINYDEFGYLTYTDQGINFAKRIFDVVSKVKEKYSEITGYRYNIEQIPGERACAIFCSKDKLFFPEEKINQSLYSNQWIALSEKASVQERVRVGQILDNYLSGGVIFHANMDAPFTNKETAWNMLNYIASHHIPYFAFNGKQNSCEHNHGFYENKCPICGGDVKTQWTRIVGFSVPVINFSSERTEEYNKRYWNNPLEFDKLFE